MSQAYQLQVVRTKIAEPSEPLTNPSAVAQSCQDLVKFDREHLVRLDLNNHCEVIGRETVHIGTADAVNISPREIFRGALLSGATRVIVVHNHPSGSAEPSDEDLGVLRRLWDAGQMLDLELLDFVIVTDSGRYWSESGGAGCLRLADPSQQQLAD